MAKEFWFWGALKKYYMREMLDRAMEQADWENPCPFQKIEDNVGDQSNGR
jgi:hypothetical protein